MKSLFLGRIDSDGPLSKHPKFEGVFRISQGENRQPGHDEFGAWKDCLRRNDLSIDRVEYRTWDPYRSKLAVVPLAAPR